MPGLNKAAAERRDQLLAEAAFLVLIHVPAAMEAVDRIFEIGSAARAEVEKILGPLDSFVGEDHDFALDEMQQQAEQSDHFIELGASWTRSESAWMGSRAACRPNRLRAGRNRGRCRCPQRAATNSLTLRRFVGTSPDLWGRLLTPLVTGLRISGPFRPQWVPKEVEYRHVFIDTEGLLHARTATEVPGELTSRFGEVDTILMVETANNSLHSPAAAKVFEAIASTGYVSKFVLAFTHMDVVTGDDLSDAKSKKDKVFAGVRNVLDNHVARNVSREAARQLEQQLETNTFYLEYMDPKKYPTADKAGAIRVKSARQLVYNDGRADLNGRVPDNTWVLRPQDQARYGQHHRSIPGNIRRFFR